MEATTVGVLALQGGFQEHMHMLERAAQCFPAATPARTPPSGVTITVAAAAAAAAAGRPAFAFLEVRNTEDLARCDALLIPGGESTTISIVAQACGLLEPLRDFVK
jgi:5'-phosphate synthase pdxT subunit